MLWLLALATLPILLLKTSAFKVAFLGDSGVLTDGKDGFSAAAVFEMLKDEGVDLVVQNGDLDYEESPTMWDNFIQKYVFDEGMEILLSSGNHEEEEEYGAPWYGSQGYKARMLSHLKSSDIFDEGKKCTGEYGERYYCEFDATLIVMIGWRQTSSSEELALSATFLNNVFKSTKQLIKFCVWHQPEGILNPGEDHYENYYSQELYEICRKNAAIIVSGHSHIYSRTKLISSFLPNGAKPASNPDPTISSHDDGGDVSIDCGRTFSVISGIGGYKFEDEGPNAFKPHFRTKFTGNNSDKRGGSLICDIPSNPSSSLDVEFECEFKLSTGAVIEDFDVFIAKKSFGSSCFLSETISTTRFCSWLFC